MEKRYYHTSVYSTQISHCLTPSRRALSSCLTCLGPSHPLLPSSWILRPCVLLFRSSLTLLTTSSSALTTNFRDSWRGKSATGGKVSLTLASLEGNICVCVVEVVLPDTFLE